MALQRDRPAEVLDVVKFICREFWAELHGGKAIDKLQTNNKGVFVLQDFNFRWARFLSAPAPPPAGAAAQPGAGTAAAGSAAAPPAAPALSAAEETKQLALKYLIFPCGLVRGALAAFDVDAYVNADVSACPRVVFHVRVKDAAQ